MEEPSSNIEESSNNIEESRNNMEESISKIYTESLFSGGMFNTKNISQYEMNQHLEKTLWPLYKGENDRPHIMSIVIMINEKFRERLPAIWQSLQESPEHFPALFSHICHMILTEKNLKTKTAMLTFLNHCFNSVEIPMVRNEIQKYVSMTLWTSLSKQRLEYELESVPKLKKLWKKLEKADSNRSEEQLKVVNFERSFMKTLILDYFNILSNLMETSKKPKFFFKDSVNYCERFLEFLIDLEALLPTRRFFNSLLDDLHVVTLSRLSPLAQQKSDKEGKLFSQLLENLMFYARFEIDAVSGDALDEKMIEERHLKKIVKLQHTVFKLFPDDENVRPLYIDGISRVETRDRLIFLLGSLCNEDLIKLCCSLDLGFQNGDEIKECFKLFPNVDEKRFLLEILVYRYEKVDSQLKNINRMPLYPNESVIWDRNLVPSDVYYGDSVLPLPKLGIQFLTLHDYLLRNFYLFRLESAYEIRQDLEQAIAHLNPWKDEAGEAMFGGWARMAIPIDSFVVNNIGKPNVGSPVPSRVKADVIVNLNVKRHIKKEWEQLRKHDVCFLVTVKPHLPPGSRIDYKESIVQQTGIVHVRGCEIEGMLDPNGKIVDEFNAEYGPYGSRKLVYNTDFRTYRIILDANQYYLDLNADKDSDRIRKMNVDEEEIEDVYGSFNVLVRRKAKANNFKAVLETIRDLMNTKFVVPDWLNDVILGYGDPSSANYKNLKVNQTIGYDKEIDFYDTFVDTEHVEEVYKGKTLVFEDKTIDKTVQPPFKVAFNNNEAEIAVKSVELPFHGPYVDLKRGMNKCRFTTTQVEAIRSGLNHGLTMVVGPPGTGKTDLAVQIINLIYHNHPDQRTLIVTHSNQALNAIFEKIMALNIDQRHLLRLGHGEEALETEEDFSRYGRVDYVLKKRLELLSIVGRIAVSIGSSEDVSHTCETASYFYLYKVVSTWESYLEIIKNTREPAIVAEKFPFAAFFQDVYPAMFKGADFDEDFKVAKGCFRYIKDIFEQLEEFKPFEMLRSGVDRSNYLMLKEAKIIAMTCTHAALRRKELSTLGFQYDNILMEESAQILEIETFIPLLLQNSDFGHNRLKRWIMIGDHLQLPPVIQNMSFQKYCNMEQSLFARFVRLGVPTIYLDAQGRSRDELARLWSWRYKNLGSLPHVEARKEFRLPNPGFEYNYQLINVPDFDGNGESEPVAHFYQNLAEAEFVVGTYMYMRLIGYPQKKITILTTYNGQKHLIRDIAQQRCASNPFIGLPDKITTVDKFQGQQNDYILLSLVRTKAYGHIRDIRRLTVAMSRARLGLYVFARANLFSKCFELQKTFQLLMERPVKLSLIPDEEYSMLDMENGFQREENFRRLEIDEMPKMHDFVFDFYDRRTAWLQSHRPEVFDSIMKVEEKNPENSEIIQNPEGDVEMVEGTEGEMEVEKENMDQEENVEGMEELPFEPLGEQDKGITDDLDEQEVIQDKTGSEQDK